MLVAAIFVCVFLCGVAVGDIASFFINRRFIMPAIDDLKASVASLKERVATLQTASDPSAAIATAVAANQAENDAAIDAVRADIDTIDAAPAAPAA